MQLDAFLLLLGVALLSFLVVVTLYVVWSRIVGLDPTLAQGFVSLSGVKRFAMALVSGVLLGVSAVLAPSVPVGVAAIVMLAASTFAALMLFELVRKRHAT
ncbi:hypothetical protein [Haladaptatus salinisoli]|uniref:hypothetical protein n=1 Tax=Haladaptatus salinisoli TaxID=2884876 RepID=UPI001D0BCF70|nr:hypothetical protein [Haladaptatus salinisoli]